MQLSPVFIRVSLFVIIVFGSCLLRAQEEVIFGQLTPFDKNFTTYQKAPEASAVVLYEKGNHYFKEIRSKLFLVKTYHSKIKILKQEGFENATISIPLLEDEKLTELNAITHNGEDQEVVSPDQIFMEQKNEYSSIKKFSFPNLRVGSIIEYKYEIVTPYFYTLDGWSFQSKIPKIYSEYNAKIPGLLKYNRALVGSLKLDINEAHIEKHCFKGTFIRAACEVLKYVMRDIPALEAADGFVLSVKNYTSRLKFELFKVAFNNSAKAREPITWAKIDRNFQKSESIGPQLKKKGFFKKRAPDDLFKGDYLSRAKKIYGFVKEHFTWDRSYGVYTYNNVKEAFRKRKGNVAEINMSLITLLNEAGIEANLMLVSTRKNGLPKRSYPSINDFDYFIARVRIDGQEYLLDASNKLMPFGLLPFRALNHYGRLMNFEGPSYWYDILPYAKNKYLVRSQISLDVKSGSFSGIIDTSRLGYLAFDNRNLNDGLSEEEYLNRMEEHFQNVEITGYGLVGNKNSESQISERFQFSGDSPIMDNKIYLNPFLIKFFDKNPFQLEMREYPIDFGYPRTYRFQT